jgi:hypothetical protein
MAESFWLLVFGISKFSVKLWTVDFFFAHSKVQNLAMEGRELYDLELWNTKRFFFFLTSKA